MNLERVNTQLMYILLRVHCVVCINHTFACTLQMLRYLSNWRDLSIRRPGNGKRFLSVQWLMPSASRTSTAPTQTQQQWLLLCFPVQAFPKGSGGLAAACLEPVPTSKQKSRPRMLLWSGLTKTASSAAKSRVSMVLAWFSKDSWERDSFSLGSSRGL